MSKAHPATALSMIPREESQRRQPLATAILDTAVTSAGFVVLTFVSGILIARILGVEARGQYGAVQFWANLAIYLGGLSVFDAATVRIRNENIDIQSSLPTLLIACLALWVVGGAFISAAVYARLISVPDVNTVTFSVFSILVLGLGHIEYAFIAIESAKLDFEILNIERILSPLAFSAVLLAIFFLHTGGLLLVLMAFVLSKLPVLLWRLFRFRHCLFGSFNSNFIHKIAGLGLRFHGAAVTLLLAGQIDRLILVSVWPPERLGNYFVAYSAAGAAFTVLSQAIGLTVMPSLAGLSGEQRKFKLETMMRLATVGSLALGLIIFLISPILIPIVFGSAFKEAAWYTQGLAVALALSPLKAIISAGTRAAEKGRAGIEMALVSIIIFTIAFFITRFESATDIFVALAFANVIQVAVGVYHLKRECSVRIRAALLPSGSDILFLVGQSQSYYRIMRRRILNKSIRGN